ncbi:A-kinase anchor protein 17A [Apodemus sylvaticus]|uniref:A-kinase anchor protein 17A n=1 Tax=Apodemus sylvaticus TaxID=10129 RepID=UPI002241C1F8|nr:A-kinase anchor protein 17A [Apodemus sylvaticus]XP_052027997.1 A-kinase anchor protein 17A [Apodemus sylvaticus]XP_052027998.1 A-kinase anchor protein 17A [Apodemus sylvaticus]
MSSAATIVHDTSEAVALCPALGLYLKPITKMTISVALPPLRTPGKSISNWEVMERLKAMVAAAAPHAPLSALRIAKSTLDFVRFEGEVENRAAVRAALACLDGRTIKLSGFADALRVRAAEFRADFPSRHDWDAFFRDARDMDEALPGERPDTIHLEGLPCRWFAPREGAAGPAAGTSGAASGAGGGTSGSGPAAAGSAASGAGPALSGPGAAPASERPSEALLRQAFGAFGEIRHVDIPMLDPYRGDMAGGRSFHTFSFGGHLNFEAYVQYREYAGFARAMAALRGMKLMFKGEDGKAVACGIKVSFDATKHLSDASIRRRQLERQKLQELELQREEQKRREKEAEERRRAEERKQREAEEQERARRREEKLRRREQRQRAREQRRSRRRVERLQAEEQRRLRERVRAEERRLLLAQRNLQSIRLVAELLSRAEAARRRERAQSEERRRRAREAERRRQQEAELRRVEEEKRRALGLQRRERELRQRLVSLLLARRPDRARAGDLLRPVLLDVLRGVARAQAGGGDAGGGKTEAGTGDAETGSEQVKVGSCDFEAGSGESETGSGKSKPGSGLVKPGSEPLVTGSDVTDNAGGVAGEKDPSAPTQVLACITDNAPPKATPTPPGGGDARPRSERDKCNREPRPQRKPREEGGTEEGEEPPRAASQERERRRDKDREHGRDRKRARRHREDRGRSRSRSPRHRPAWNR